MAYGNTFILLVTDGSHGDATAASNADKLKWKGKVDDDGMNLDIGAPDRIMIKKGPADGTLGIEGGTGDLSEVTAHDRLFVVGHGSYGDAPTIGSKSAATLASQMHAAGFRAAKVVSLVSCNSGYGWGDNGLLSYLSPASIGRLPFGKLFADRLTALGVTTEVRARVGYVTVLKSGRKKVDMIDWKYSGNVVIPKGWNKRSWAS